jgi:hypothetical protein
MTSVARAKVSATVRTIAQAIRTVLDSAPKYIDDNSEDVSSGSFNSAPLEVDWRGHARDRFSSTFCGYCSRAS